MNHELIEEENFEEYTKFFKEQPTKEKRDIIYEQLKMLAAFTNNMCKEYKIPNELIVNRELLDLNKEDCSEDDYLEAIMVVVNSIQNSICDFSNGLADRIDELDNTNED